ncbi:MAG: TIGR02266 family protein [Sandaracinaceae bacterium]|nr:TIGR02266 family protein [Sandaracinaceae bacterium]
MLDEPIAQASLAAAGQARADLAQAAAELAQAQAFELELRLGRAAKLLALDKTDPSALHGCLADVMKALGAVLLELQTQAAPETELATVLVARTMARLHPLRMALEEEVAQPVAVPLLRTKKHRPVLEVVPDDEPSAERRELPRVALEVDIGLHSETNFFVGFGDDISEGGLFVATYDLLPVGRELTLSFLLPDGTPVTVLGRVAWIREPRGLESSLQPGMGVTFVDLDPESLDAIRRYTRLRPPMFHSD